MDAKIGINPGLLAKVAADLSKILADEFVLCTKTRNAHWNVEGSDFHSAHKFFEDQYGILDDAMDDVAERIRAIGHYAPATMKEFLQLTRLAEGSHSSKDSQAFMKILLSDHEMIIGKLRESIGIFVDQYKDMGSGDFVTGLMEKHEKMAWMLRAHIK